MTERKGCASLGLHDLLKTTRNVYAGGSFEGGVGDAIKGIDNRGDKLVRPNHQRHDQNPSNRAKDGSDFGQSGSEFGEFGAEFSKNGSVGTDRMQLFPSGRRLMYQDKHGTLGSIQFSPSYI